MVILIAYVPHLTLRKKWHKGLKIQMGLWSKEFSGLLSHERNIWVHAVSVGEVLAIKSFIDQMIVKYPRHRFILSTVTRTGYAVAVAQIDKRVQVMYAPFDFSWVVQKYIKVIRPKLYVAAETEIWPNLYKYLKLNHVPIIQINGRLSDKSFRGYRKIKPFLKKTLQKVDRLCMQSDNDRDRVCQLGADRQKVNVTGNLKFDNMQSAEAVERSALGYAKADLIWIAGSTHPGEEKIIIDVFKELRTMYPVLKLILAPRHIERAAEVLALIKNNGLQCTCLSERLTQQKEVFLVDTIGQLRSLYSLADFVFIGKTLVGKGGQNILEPAQFAKPIIVGPHMQNFRAVMDVFVAADAVKVVCDQKALCSMAKNLIDDVHLRKTLGSKAKCILEEHQGATEHTIKLIEDFITG